MFEFFVGIVVGILFTYTAIEYLIFKVAQKFHNVCGTDLTLKKYFTGKD